MCAGGKSCYNISPGAVIILSLIFWAAVLGPFGALLAVPLTLTVKELVLEADKENRWLAELMSGGDKNEVSGNMASGDDQEIDTGETG